MSYIIHASFALLTVVSIISCCVVDSFAADGSAPILLDLVEVSHVSQQPERDIRTKWPYLPPYLGQPSANPNLEYVVQLGDTIEILLEPSSAATPKLSVELSYPGTSDLALIRGVRRPKFLASLLVSKRAGVRLDSVYLRAQDSTATLNVSAFTIPGDSWGAIRSRFEALTLSIDGTTYQIRARLLPAPAQRAVPGDTVMLYRLELDANRVQHTQEFELQVDSGGYLWIPPSTTAMITPGDPLSQKDSHLRGLFGSVDQGYFRVQVADPSKPLAEQRTLQEVAQQLSSLTTSPDDQTLAAWHELGIDEQFLSAGANTSGARYQMILVTKREWTLIDEKGRRLVQSHSGYELLVDAVKAAYPRMGGQELLAGATGPGSLVFVTVVPDGCDFNKSTLTPFFARVDSGDLYSALRYVSLQPGDTVVVSRQAPDRVLSSLP